MRSEATFDSLFICSGLETVVGGATVSELQTVTYLARLLSEYEQPDATLWGYDFAATSTGAPFSPVLGEAIDDLCERGWLAATEAGWVAASFGTQQLDFLKSLQGYRTRQRFLEAAVESTLVIPLPVVTSALLREPQLRTPVQGAPAARPLLDETGRVRVRPYLRGVEKALKSVSKTRPVDLLTVAVLWLRYLQSESISESSGV